MHPQVPGQEKHHDEGVDEAVVQAEGVDVDQACAVLLLVAERHNRLSFLFFKSAPRRGLFTLGRVYYVHRSIGRRLEREERVGRQAMRASDRKRARR